MAKVVLAYSGGLATSICLHYLKQKKGFEVITYTANVGQGELLEPVGERAIELGAKVAHLADLRERLLLQFCFKALQAQARHPSGYLLSTALTRPLIVSEMVKIALEDGCEYLAHGCTGKGNDQVRFEAASAGLAPHLKVISPLAEAGLTSRAEQLRYAERYGLPGLDREPSDPAPLGAKAAGAKTYWIDYNLWGGAVYCPSADDAWDPLPEEAYRTTTAPERAPDRPDEVAIGFKDGIAVKLDGDDLPPVVLVERLQELGGRHGIGRLDVLEDRIVGIKSREVYEAPAATVLYEAHRALESLVMTRDLLHFKPVLSQKYAELIYCGLWWSELQEALTAFFQASQKYVTGEVRVRLLKGAATATGVRSPFSLYDKDLATYSEGDLFDHRSARGFLDIYSLALRTEASHWKDREFPLDRE